MSFVKFQSALIPEKKGTWPPSQWKFISRKALKCVFTIDNVV